jgi:hypothetical protein
MPSGLALLERATLLTQLLPRLVKMLSLLGSFWCTPQHRRVAENRDNAAAQRPARAEHGPDMQDLGHQGVEIHAVASIAVPVPGHDLKSA